MKRLQRFDFKFSQYARPNQDWVCGREEICDACPLGPDAKGACRATAECKPRKDGDRWQCTRADSRGGTCPEGPRPDGSCCRPIPRCTPRRSVRAQRGVAALLAVAFTLGAVLILLGRPEREQVFSPGHLIAPHASGEIKCTMCHAAAQTSSREWLQAAFIHANARADTDLCLKCHQLGSSPTRPHGIPHAQLAFLTRSIAIHANGPVLPPFAADPTRRDELDCATCHSEHHGRNFDLKKTADASCQTCHTAAFASFTSGHPDFGSYPYERPTRIAFDHAGHFANYFQQAGAPRHCNDCHVPDAANRLMLTKSFETTCAACHLSGITRPGAKGLAVLLIPGLDPKFASAHGLGRWPADADGELTPFMRQLLAQDPAVAAALVTLRDTDLTNLAKADPAVAAAAEQLAWGVKELFADLLTRGHDALKKRLGPAPDDALGRLPSESVQAFTQPGWWPDLLAEVAAHRAGQPLPAAGAAAPPAAAPTPAVAPVAQPKPPGSDDLLGGDDPLAGPTPAAPAPSLPSAAAQTPAPVSVSPDKWVSTGGWYVTPDDYTLRYRPTGHADTFLRAWLDLEATQATGTPQRDSFAELKANTSCLKCHTVEDATAPALPFRGLAPANPSMQTAGLRINWQSATPTAHLHTFTKFSHGTHFALLDEKGCQTCHQINPVKDQAAPPGDSGSPAPKKFASSFQPLRQAVCAECHVAAKAGNSCLLCHNYHVGEFAPANLSNLAPPVASAFKPSSPGVPGH